ncbi:MAG: PQQ-binding-like beta-propeller repeat protein, partial [Gemmobacter sp.]
SFDVTPAGESPEAASGGGLAVGDGKLFVTTGFGELIALNPATGAVLWRQRFDGPVSGAPAVVGGTVYVAGRDAAAWAVNAADGKIRWVQSGVRQSAGLLGGSAPAVADKVVVMPFASGQVAALDRAKGDMAWMGAVAGQRAGRAAAFVADLTGDPVVSGGRVYVGSAAGRTAAFRLDTGEMLWEAREGAMGPVWPVGNAVFTVTDDGRLVRLDAATGETVWATPLGHFTNDRPRRQLGVVAHYGPVLAGGRLVVASSDGLVRFVAPDSGAVLGVIEMGPGGGAAAAPAVAGGTLYVVTTGGQVQAFR